MSGARRVASGYGVTLRVTSQKGQPGTPYVSAAGGVLRTPGGAGGRELGGIAERAACPDGVRAKKRGRAAL